MKKPMFFCIGAQKAGTTTLHYILNQHPEIFLPEIKEIHFFDRETNFSKGYDWYNIFFEDVKTEKAIGEICPNYLYDKKTAQRLFEFNPNCKLIVLLRNPAERAFSHYKMRFGRGDEKSSFKNAINRELQNIKKETEYPLSEHYISRGYYDIQLQKYFDIFDKKNILILSFEDDFLKNKNNTIKKILNFIGVNRNVNLALNVKATPEVSWKSEKVYNALYTKSKLNQFAKKIISSKNLRIKIKYIFSNLNQKSNRNKQELDELKPYLINKVFNKSIIELEKITELNFDNWRQNKNG